MKIHMTGALIVASLALATSSVNARGENTSEHNTFSAKVRDIKEKITGRKHHVLISCAEQCKKCTKACKEASAQLERCARGHARSLQPDYQACKTACDQAAKASMSCADACRGAHPMVNADKLEECIRKTKKCIKACKMVTDEGGFCRSECLCAGCIIGENTMEQCIETCKKTISECKNAKWACKRKLERAADDEFNVMNAGCTSETCGSATVKNKPLKRMYD